MVPLFGCRMCKSCITSKNSSLPLGRSVASSLIRSFMLKRRRLSTARKIKHFLLLTDNNKIQHHNFHLFRQQNTHTASYDNLIYKLFTLFYSFKRKHWKKSRDNFILSHLRHIFLSVDRQIFSYHIVQCVMRGSFG